MQRLVLCVKEEDSLIRLVHRSVSLVLKAASRLPLECLFVSSVDLASLATLLEQRLVPPVILDNTTLAQPKPIVPPAPWADSPSIPEFQPALSASLVNTRRTEVKLAALIAQREVMQAIVVRQLVAYVLQVPSPTMKEWRIAHLVPSVATNRTSVPVLVLNVL
jgi:hypothetical protein